MYFNDFCPKTMKSFVNFYPVCGELTFFDDTKANKDRDQLRTCFI